LREEEARAILNAGCNSCPRCQGLLKVSSKSGFLFKVSFLHCPKCNTSWEDTTSFYAEVEHAKIENLKKEGLSKLCPSKVSIVLDKDEIVYAIRNQVQLYQKRRYTYRSPSTHVSLRLARGLWVHPKLGGGEIENEEVMKLLDTGLFVVTNKRLIFKGRARSTSTKLEKLMAVDVDVEMGRAGCVYVSKEGKQTVDAYYMSWPNLMKEFILHARENRMMRAP
jgi:DNA-directed RNA polymerase subunit M/transcription elongation factor TFIIS